MYLTQEKSAVNDYVSRDEYLKRFSIEIDDICSELDGIDILLEKRTMKSLEEVFYPKIDKSNMKLVEEVSCAGWILPTSTFTATTFLQIMEDALEENLTVDEMFINKLMVSSLIEETLNYWKKAQKSNVEKRIHILEEAVKFHLEEKYYVSVSTLIPQLEGLLRDAIKNSNISTDDFKSLTANRMKSATESLAQEWKKQFVNSILENYLELLETLPEIIFNLYQDYKSEVAIPNGLYRHGICHGLQTDFGTAKNSLRLILIIDRIIFFMVG